MLRPRFARPNHRSPGHRYASKSEIPTAAADYGTGGVNSTLPVDDGAGTELWIFAASELFLLAFLAADSLAGVSDAFALVWLGGAKGADLGGDLPDALPVGAADGDHRGPLTGDPDVLRYRKRNIMAVAELQVQGAALNRSTIAHPIDLQTDREALRHPGYHIVHQRPGGAPHRAGFLGVVGRRYGDCTVRDRSQDGVADHHLQCAEPAFGGQGVAGELDLDPARDGYRIFADARHVQPQKMRQRTSPPTFAARASLSERTPRGVDRIAIPSPL